MQSSLILLNETSTELIIYVRPYSKKKETQYLYMRFDKNKTESAIYHCIKKASSLRYDFGSSSVKIEINGLPSTEMSCILSTKLLIK